MELDHKVDENPHETYNNSYEPQEQTGAPQQGSKKVKQANHTHQTKTREG